MSLNKIIKLNILDKRLDSICGNAVVEPPETCDCGTDCSKFEDSCCVQAGSVSINGQNECQLSSFWAKCSPTDNKCCSKWCMPLIIWGNEYKCSEENECVSASYCQLYSFTCPPSKPRLSTPSIPIPTCNNGQHLCDGSKCTTRSICENAGLKECYLDPEDSHLCDMACVTPSGSKFFIISGRVGSDLLICLEPVIGLIMKIRSVNRSGIDYFSEKFKTSYLSPLYIFSKIFPNF